ncbi:hypothetical protein GCM10027054_12230 [Isoptericola nanjingensis]
MNARYNDATIGNAVNTTKPTNHGDRNANPAPASRRRDRALRGLLARVGAAEGAAGAVSPVTVTWSVFLSRRRHSVC